MMEGLTTHTFEKSDARPLPHPFSKPHPLLTPSSPPPHLLLTSSSPPPHLPLTSPSPPHLLLTSSSPPPLLLLTSSSPHLFSTFLLFGVVYSSSTFYDDGCGPSSTIANCCHSIPTKNQRREEERREEKRREEGRGEERGGERRGEGEKKGRYGIGYFAL